MTLKQYNQRYEDILHSSLSADRKAVQFAELMTELEVEYKIPMIRNQEWEAENKSVIALYRKISMSRDF